MKTSILALGIAAQMFVLGAHAQGEVGGSRTPPPAASVSPAEKAAARAERKAEGAEAVRKPMAGGEVGATKAPPPAMKPAPEEKAAARAQRKAEGAEAIKKQPGGEVGPTK